MFARLLLPLPRLALLTLLCAASLYWSKLAPAAAFLVLVGGLSLPKLEPAARRQAWALLIASTLLACVGFTRFVLNEAIPGVIAGGKAAATKHAIAFARSVVVAQDHARKQAWLDPDRDGVGSALELPALAGLAPLRQAGPQGAVLATAPLRLRPEQIKDSRLGASVVDSGYLFALCLPAQGGGWTTGAQPVDEEAAERSYALYAWPMSDSPGSPRAALFLDAQERILVHGEEAESARYFGYQVTPDCNSAENDAGWHNWKDKQARESLPGDPS